MSVIQRPVNIMLVDDDEINNFITVKLIRKAFPDSVLSTYLNGRLAIDRLKDILQHQPENIPDYILLDINMPVMNGWEFLEEYKQLNFDSDKKITIYILSSSVFSNDIDKSKSYESVASFISKPLNLESIKEVFSVLNFHNH
ncbi:response regulator [Mucilaginibacter arboris]|uniref:Response regulator n=1 Tax=Mucilaginibacter arboris TaxID=2682090 RepID=A0A7K1STP9_9SPHI|nr:response regulator [Mucilaginibacter arboris]MVN20696.1 response regulator [Mucilaginibacter arboris]